MSIYFQITCLHWGWGILYPLMSTYRLQYSHRVINHCDRRITHPGDLDTSFVLLDMSSKFLVHLECYLLSSKRHIKISK